MHVPHPHAALVRCARSATALAALALAAPALGLPDEIPGSFTLAGKSAGAQGTFSLRRVPGPPGPLRVYRGLATGEGSFAFQMGMPIGDTRMTAACAGPFVHEQAAHRDVTLTINVETGEHTVSIGVYLPCQGKKDVPLADRVGLPYEKRWSGTTLLGTTYYPALQKGGKFVWPPGQKEVSLSAETAVFNGSTWEPLTATWVLGRESSQADPGGPYEVERGGVVTLDGSRSRAVESARWRVAPRCPDGVAGPEPIEREGLRVSLATPCDLEVALTVTGGGKTSSASARVTARPRPFQTRQPDTVVGQLEGEAPPLWEQWCPEGEAGPCVVSRGGSNVCACGHPNHTLHPGVHPGEHRTLDGNGYELAQVADPGGPFHGWWTVTRYAFVVERRALVNRWLRPGAPPPLPRYKRSFYELNRGRGNDVDGYLAAIAAHEGEGRAEALGHSGLIRAALRKADPARQLEALVAPPAEREQLVARADEILRSAEEALCEASKDPLDPIWSGKLAVHAKDGSTVEEAATGEHAPLEQEAFVGGKNYGASGSCAIPRK